MHGPPVTPPTPADPEQHSHQEVVWRSASNAAAASNGGSGGAASPLLPQLGRLGSLPRSDRRGSGSGDPAATAATTMARALGGALRRAAAGIWGGGDRSAARRGQHHDRAGGGGGGRGPSSSSASATPTAAAAAAAAAASKREELISGAAFCAASLAMTLLNKAALSPHNNSSSSSGGRASSSSSSPSSAPQPQHNLPFPVVSLLAVQCLCTLLLTYAACALGLGRAPPRMGARELRLWLPVNALFAAMVATSFLALRHMGVPMLTVLKNLTSLLVIAGDRVVFGKTYGAGVWLTLALMTASALCAAGSDLEFSPRGYAWQLANNVATAAYSLGLRLAIVKMREGEDGGFGGKAEQGREEEEGGEEGGGGQEGGRVGGAGAAEVEDGRGGRRVSSAAAKRAPASSSSKAQARRPPDDVGMVIYNNLGALPMLALLAVASGEPARLMAAPPAELRALASDRRFVASALSSCVTGFLLSVASMWFMRCTTATTFSLVGSLNKVPLAVLGALLFAPPAGKAPAWSSPWHVASVAVGLCAGAVFAHAKSQEDRRQSLSPRGGSGHEHRR